MKKKTAVKVQSVNPPKQPLLQLQKALGLWMRYVIPLWSLWSKYNKTLGKGDDTQV